MSSPKFIVELQIWIFKFAGSSHQNYMSYLLEVYCMLRYEASKDLRNAILNNWLLNIKGELGKWIPADLHQEHYNKWLEDMIQKHGGEFNNKFYRQTISPNVHHFLQIKEEVETAFNLEHRGKTHTSPHLQSELQLLLTAFKEEEVHLFRSGRSMGHAAVNQFARGCRRLDEGKLEDWLAKLTIFGDFLKEFQRVEDSDLQMRSDSPTPSTDSSSDSRSISSSRSSSEEVDPNEPDDDGEDLSASKLTSGSRFAMIVDQDSGQLIMGMEDVDEEVNSEDEEDGEEEDEQEEEPEEESSEEDEDEDDY